ncbi:unnamed protein product [Absidia cylindrospora]
MGLSCEYSDPPKKRGPPKGQVEIIESRAHRIESLRVGTGILQNHKLSLVSPVPVTHGTNGYALISDFYNNGDNTPFSLENNTVLRLISGAVDAVQTNNPPLDQQDTPGSHYIKNDFFMKDHRLANNYQKWTSCYFAHFNVFFPVLSQPHYMQQLSQQNVDPLLFYAVCTIGAKYSDGDQETSHFLFERCQHLLNMSHDSVTLCTVQALVILCWYANLLAKMQTCAELRQRLNQAVNGLQLFWDPGSSLGIVSVEMHRRAFWVAYVTDQWLSCCTGERFLVLPDGWHCQWPRLEDSQLLVIDKKQSRINNNHDEMIHTQKHQYQYQHQHQHQQVNDSPANFIPDLSAEYALQITAFSEMIKLACIVDEVHDLYAPSSKTPVWHHQQAIVSRLTHWLVHLPFYLEYGKPKEDAAPSPMARIYHMLYYTVQIMLYQPYLQQSTQTSPVAFNLAQSPSSAPPSPAPSNNNNPMTASDINMARSICTNAANTIVHISEQMIQHHQHMYLHNTFLISLTLASSMQLDNAMNSEQRHGISSLFNLGKGFDVLKHCNCTVLSPMQLDQLLNRFLLDHYGIRLDGNPQSTRKRTCDLLLDDTDDTPGHLLKRRHQLPSCTTQVSSLNNNKDDLLDTRLHHLLQFSHSIPSPSASSSSASIVLDPSWLDETSSILDLFPQVPAAAAAADTLYSPVSFISPTQSPTLSSDSNDYYISTGHYGYPFTPPSMDFSAFMSDIPPYTH